MDCKYRYSVVPATTPAVTIKEIRGACIPTIPVGTKCEITYIHRDYSYCNGLPVTSVWNNEVALEGDIS